ncbi:MAG: putative serine/threonine protein kinase, partial [Streblomastix strix]
INQEHIQIGRECIYGKIPRGAYIITESFAKQLKVKKDDEIQFMFSVANFTSMAADVIDQQLQRSMPLMMELLSSVPIKLIIFNVKWASKITYALRFGELDVQMPVASAFEDYSMLGMMINMISMLIIVVLVGISILLMYSLLMIFVDTRTFEIGILRMVGLDRFVEIGILIAQTLLYSIPGWILGIILGFVGNYIVMYILEDATSVSLQKVMPVLSIVISTLITFGISFIASILPIRQALSQNLLDSIDVIHTKASAIIVTIEY